MIGIEDPWLDVREVTVAYGSTVALDAVSVSVAEGQTLAVVGPSGSGKTTLLRAVAGLEPLRSGTISAGGLALASLATHERDLGLMFQDHALFPQLDVAGNVGFGLRMAGWSADRRRGRVGELLDLMGLEGFQKREVHELSGGEAQRVALARALAPQPRLLMLDEPFGSLDRVLREQLTGDLRRLLDELGQTALHITHDQEEAFALADQVAVLRDGRLEQAGRPEDLWHRPMSAFVAEFLGHPNRWLVEVDDDGTVVFGSVSLSRTALDRTVIGRTVIGRTASIQAGRHEVVVPMGAVTVAQAESKGVLEARVVRAVFREGGYRIEAEIQTGVGPGVAPGLVTFEHHARLERGQIVLLSVAVDRLHMLGG